MNVSFQCDSRCGVTEHLAERLDLKADLNAPCSKGMAKRMEMDIFSISQAAPYSLILYCKVRGSMYFPSLPVSKNAPGFARFICSRHSSIAAFVRGSTRAEVFVFGLVKMIFVLVPPSRFFTRRMVSRTVTVFSFSDISPHLNAQTSPIRKPVISANSVPNL